MKRVGVAFLFLALASVGVAGQTHVPMLTITVVDAQGKVNSIFYPRAEKQKNPTVQGMTFFRRHDVRSKAGKIVSGLGFATWREGPGVYIAVFQMVPKDGATNAFHALSPADMANLRAEPFADFSLLVGKSRPIDEMKALGLDPMVVQLSLAPPVGRD